MKVNEEQAIQFLKKLININSVNPPGNEVKVAQLISEYAKQNDLYSEIKPLSNDRANIIVRLKGNDSKGAPLVFSGHLDTVPIGDVPWNKDPFSGEIIDGKIYGRGSCDMKSGVAALIESMILIKKSNQLPKSDIIFVGTAGEEVDCIGARRILDEDIIKDAGAIVIAEPSNCKVISAHKGALWIEIAVYGKTAHGSMPSEGTNAIVHMSEILNKVKQYNFPYTNKHKLLGSPSLNISTINGGIKTNVVPDLCTLTIDIRTIPGIRHEDIIKDFNDLLLELNSELEDFSAELRVLNNLNPVENKENDKFVKLALQINYSLNGYPMVEKGANYYTDGSVFSTSLDVPIIIYGPGDEKIAHKPNEFVEINQFLKSIKFYTELAKQF